MERFCSGSVGPGQGRTIGGVHVGPHVGDCVRGTGQPAQRPRPEWGARPPAHRRGRYGPMGGIVQFGRPRRACWIEPAGWARAIGEAHTESQGEASAWRPRYGSR